MSSAGFCERRWGMPGEAVRAAGCRCGGVVSRIPAFLLCVAALALFVALPYRSLDSDVTTFGIMGNDLLRLGYLPSLTYGQNYLFSFTPYSYALLRWVFPGLDPGLALVLGGAVFSITGLWLLAESLLVLLRGRGERPLLPLGLFCLAIASSSLYLFDIETCSSIEMSLFLLGLVFYAAARLEAGATRNPAAALTSWWLLLGLATSATLYTRPQIALYGIPLMVAFLARVRRLHGGRVAKRRGVLLAAGALAGYLPMLAHHVFRAADWPFRNHLHPKLALLKTGDTAARFFKEVGARIFGVCADHPVFSAISLAWVALAILAFALAWRRNRSQPGFVSALDAAWLIGSLGIVLTMILVPAFVMDGESRRYCLHVLPATAWLFARFVPLAGGGWSRWAAAMFAMALAAASVPVWTSRIDSETLRNEGIRDIRDRFLPELMESQAVIITDYWDAYLLAFLADGKIKIEAFPWHSVRTYGLVGRDEMRRRTLWLVRTGFRQSTEEKLVKELGPGVLDRVTAQDMREPLLGHACQLWNLGDPESAVALMQKFRKQYFARPYPPGSGGGEVP